MPGNFFNGTDAELYSGTQTFSTIIGESPTTFGLTSVQATAYATLSGAYVSAYDMAIEPATRTKGTVAAKNTAKAALKAKASDLAKLVHATTTVTDQQLINLGLNVPKMPAPVPPPSVSPGMDIVSVVNRTVKVHIHDSASSTKRGKPAGAIAAYVYSFVGTSYPSDPAAWDFEGSTTKSTYDVVFPDTVPAGQQVWVCAAWVNRKLQTGPVNSPIPTNLQGGGTSTASLALAA